MEALSTLPTTLQEIYARILDTLRSSNCYREGLFMLQYVLWAKKPPLFSEMIDAIAVHLDEDPGFKQENRLFDLMDVIAQCSSLLTPVLSGRRREIHLAHSSVKEYLMSQHLAEPLKNLLSEVHARSIIARTSMKYMLDVASLHHDLITSSGRSVDDLITMPRSPVVLSGHSLGWMDIVGCHAGTYQFITIDQSVFPFLEAAGYWAEHAAVAEATDGDIPRLVLQLYKQEHLLRGFPQILGPASTYGHSKHTFQRILCRGHRPSPLVHAC